MRRLMKAEGISSPSDEPERAMNRANSAGKWDHPLNAKEVDVPAHDAKTRRFAGLLTFLGVLALTAGHAQATCTTTWVGGTDSNFGTAGNWSTKAVPGSGDDACITATTTTNPPAVADTYTVILNGNFSIRSLTLGGPNGTQTLVLPAANLQFGLGADSVVGPNGVLTLGDSGGGYNILANNGSALTNSGHLNIIAGGGGIRYLRANINNAGGTIDIGTTTNQDQGALTTNNGSVTVEAGSSLALSDNSSFVNNGGTVVNNGAFIMSGGTFTQRGGTESGNAVVLSGSTLDDDLGSGAGLFSFTGSGTLTGSGNHPGVAAGQMITVAASDALVGLGVNLANAGTITLGDSHGGYSGLQNPGALTNSGHLNILVGGGGIRYLRANITNAGGTIDIGTTTNQDQATLITNNGMVTVEAGGSLALSGGSSFVNNGGAVVNNGAFSMSGGTFTQRGGTESGNAVVLSGSTLDDDLGSDPGLFIFTGSGTLTGSGNNPGVAAGQMITVAATDIGVAIGVNLTNEGIITLGDSHGGYSVLQNPGALTNRGQLNTIAGGGGVRYLRVNVNNAAAGVVDIDAAADTRQDSATTTTNNGSVTVGAGGSLALSGGSSFVNNGGAVVNNGAFIMSGGTFTQRGGTESGNAVVLSGSTLDDDLGSGAGLFSFTASGTLTGSGNNPGVAAGQMITVAASDISVAIAVNLTNAGTITLGDHGGGYSVLQNPGALTNSGQLNTIAGGGGARYLRLNITNAAVGTIDIGTTTKQDQGTLTTNNGTVTVEAGGSLALSGGSSFAQGMSATFAPTIDATTSTFGQLTGGGRPVSLDGKLRVTTVGSPTIGSSWPIISGASRSGQFATLDFGSNNYDVQYTSTGVTLVALAAPTPTSTPTPTQTLMNTRTATPTNTSTTPPTSTSTSATTPTPTVTKAPPLTATVTPVPTNTASFTPTASRTNTPTTTPTSTATAVSTGTLTPTLTATGAPTNTSTLPPTTTPPHTPTPTPILVSPTVTATATNTPAMVVLAGTVLSPGRGGTPGNHDEVPLAGVAVDLFLCAVRQPCLGMGTPVASVVTDGTGGFRIQISRDLLQGTLPVVAARISPTLVFRAPVLVLPTPSFARQIADGSETVVDAISEAAVRIVEDEGFENFNVAGIAAIVQAVEAANATTSLADLTPEQGVDLAQTTAAADPFVQMALHDNQFTPTPTPSASICAGDCGGTHTVAVNNIITLVNIALGTAQPSACPNGIPSGADVNVAVIIQAVNNALNGCPTG